jgi:hypothetical protein
MRSLTADGDDADVAGHEAVYLNAHAPTATVNGAPRAVLDSLAASCDAALARQDYVSPDDLASGLDPCAQATFWIECRADEPPASYQQCPAPASAWLGRFQAVFDRWQALNGEPQYSMVSSATAGLSPTKNDGISAGAATLDAALGVTRPPLDFNLAMYLAAFHIESYGGTYVSDYLHAYASLPDYGHFGTSIAFTALYLNHNEKISYADVVSFLKTLEDDSHVDLGAKLAIEDSLYQSGALD